MPAWPSPASALPSASRSWLPGSRNRSGLPRMAAQPRHRFSSIHRPVGVLTRMRAILVLCTVWLRRGLGFPALDADMEPTAPKDPTPTATLLEIRDAADPNSGMSEALAATGKRLSSVVADGLACTAKSSCGWTASLRRLRRRPSVRSAWPICLHCRTNRC